MSKLLQLNVTANWGSTGKIAEGIGAMAIKRGWESAIAFGRYSNASQSELIRVGGKTDTYLHYAQHRLLDSEGLCSRRPTRQLIRRIKEWQPDVIHLHNIHDHWLNYPLLFEYLGSVNTPVVWTFHDCWAFTGGCAHFENAGCYKWKEEDCRGVCALHRKKAVTQFHLRKKLIGALGSRLTIVCVSDWLARYASQSFRGKAGANIQVIHNGINVNCPFQPDDELRKKMILGVSNVWPAYKGLGDFVELRKQLPDDVEICLVGLTQKQIESLPEGIRGIKRTSSIDELAELYRNAAVFVNPTHNDSFPTVNLEALACGTPVVTYRTGGSPEAVDEKTGIVVEKGNVVELADSVMKVIDNPAMFRSEDCRLRATREFDKDVQFGKYIDLYESVLKSPITDFQQ